MNWMKTMCAKNANPCALLHDTRASTSLNHDTKSVVTCTPGYFNIIILTLTGRMSYI